MLRAWIRKAYENLFAGAIVVCLVLLSAPMPAGGATT
jgi:hypothetical protein